MGIFDLFKPKKKSKNIDVTIKTSIVTSEEPSQVEIARSYDKHLLEDGISLGSIILLWWSDGKSKDAYIPQYFLYDYFINANNESQKLFSKGLLRWSNPEEHLEKLKVVELKNILEKNGLSVTGRKKIELIERIKANLSNDVLSNFIVDKVYKVTSSGKILLDKYSNIIWGHKNNSKDGIINAFTFEKNLTISPTDYAIEILEHHFIKDLKNQDFGLATNCLRNISQYKNGDLETLLQIFCFEISGLQNSFRYLSWYGYYPHLGKSIKAEITQSNINELEIEKIFKQVWNKCYQLFPVSIVNKESDALNLLFLALNENKEEFDNTVKKLYKQVPDKFKLDY